MENQEFKTILIDIQNELRKENEISNQVIERINKYTSNLPPEKRESLDFFIELVKGKYGAFCLNGILERIDSLKINSKDVFNNLDIESDIEFRENEILELQFNSFSKGDKERIKGLDFGLEKLRQKWTK